MTIEWQLISLIRYIPKNSEFHPARAQPLRNIRVFTLSVLPPRRSEERHFQRSVHNEATRVEDGHCVSHLYRKAARLQSSPAALCSCITVASEPPECRYYATRRLRDTSATNMFGGGRKLEPPGWFSTRLFHFKPPSEPEEAPLWGLLQGRGDPRLPQETHVCDSWRDLRGDVFKWSTALLRDGDIKARRLDGGSTAATYLGILLKQTPF